jgi:hypothetical protein
MILIKTDATYEINREIAEKVIDKSGLRDWYTEEHIQTTLEKSPFVLIEMGWDYDVLAALVEVSKDYSNVFLCIYNEVVNPLNKWVRYIKDGKTQIRLPRVVIDGCNIREFKTLEEEMKEHLIDFFIKKESDAK